MASDNRFTCWSFVIYPDSASSDWLHILETFMFPIAISPLHDNDLNADGLPKKPHYHVLLDFGKQKKSWDQVKVLADMCGGVLAPMYENGRCESAVAVKRSYARYLCHLDNPDKTQYNVEDVICLSGFDYFSCINSVSNKYQTIRNIINFCRTEGITNFADLVDYCEEFNYPWLMCLMDSGTYFVKEYMKSRSWGNKCNS